MNKMKIYHIFVVVMLLLLTGMMTIVLFNISDNKQQEKDSFITERFYYQNNILGGLSNDRLSIKDSLRIVDSNGETVKIKWNDHALMLVMRYNGYNCSPCIAYASKKLEKYFGNITNNHNVKIIGSDVRKSMWNDNPGFLYFDGKDLFGLPLEISQTPFYFILEKGQVSHVFIPDSSFDESTEMYLKQIRKRYFPNVIFHE